MGPCPKDRFFVGRRPGLNIKVICRNSHCQSNHNGNNGVVWIQKGFTTVHMEREIDEIVCRACKQEI